jgi:hypothetical protein
MGTTPASIRDYLLFRGAHPEFRKLLIGKILGGKANAFIYKSEIVTEVLPLSRTAVAIARENGGHPAFAEVF